MDKLLTIGKVADILNVSEETLRNWHKDGFLVPVVTKGGHRRWKQSSIENFIGDNKTECEKPVCIYGRVSSHDQKQKGDLDRQLQRLSEYSAKNKYTVEYILKDVGSGLSDSRKGLLKLFKLVTEQEISKVIVEHRDRLTRFQYNFFEYFFASYNVEIEVVENKDAEENEELVEDIMMLMASFSGKLYGKRSAKRRKKKDENN